MITTYDFYKNEYYGDIVPEDAFNKYQSRAEDDLSHLTQGKVDLLTEYPKNVQKAVCALSELDYQIESAMKQSGVDESGKGKIVKSVSSGNESISYETGNNMITAVLTDTKAQQKLKYDTAAKYLSGTGLLYWGL